MTTNYAPAAPVDLAAPVAPAASRYRGAAELCAAIRAAACLAPELAPSVEFPERYARTGADVHRYPFTRPAMFEPGECIVMAPARGFGNVAEVVTEGHACQWPQLHRHPEAPGPFLLAPGDARVTFHYSTADGARGSLTVANVRAALLRLADRVHAARGAFDGKTRAAPRPKKPASSAPHVAARAMFEAGDYAGALAIAEARGAAFFGCSNEAIPNPYMAAEPADVLGIACTVARSVRTGRYRVLHTASGLSIDSVRAGAPDDRGFATGAAARDWLETRAASEDFPALLRAADKRAAPFEQAAARAAYLAATRPEFRGADEAAPAAAEPVQAAPVPVAAEAAPAAPGAARYSFDAHLIGTDSQRIETVRHVCTGPGLTSADVAAAQSRLAELAASRGLRVVSSGFGDYAARAWAEPIAPAAATAPPAATGAPVATGAPIGAPGADTGPARPVQGKTSRAAIDAARLVGAITAAAAAAPNDPEPPNPGPAAPGGRVTVREVSAAEFDATARAAAARAEFAELAAPAAALYAAADCLARISATWPHDAARAALICAGRSGAPGAAGRLAEALQRVADRGRGLERSEAARALAELRAAAGAPAENPHAPAPERIEAAAPPATQPAPVPPATQSQTDPERAHSLAAAAMARAAANPAGYVSQLAAECAVVNLELRAGIDEAANGAALRELRAELRRAQAAAATGAPPAAEPAPRAPIDGDTFRVHETLPGGAVWTGAEVQTARRAADVWQVLTGALGNVHAGCVRWATCARTGAYLMGFHRNGAKLDAPPAFVPIAPAPATHSEPPATHSGMAPAPYGHLPQFARLAIERLDTEADLRTGPRLDELLTGYARAYGQECDAHTRESAHHICGRRFYSFRPHGATEPGACELAEAAAESEGIAARAARLAAAPAAPECGGSVEFVHRTDATRRAIAGPEMSAGRGHLWRCTFFDAAGPVSDCGVGSLAAACGIALSAGFEPVPPAAELVRAALIEQAARIEAPHPGRGAASHEARRELAAELRAQAAAIAEPGFAPACVARWSDDARDIPTARARVAYLLRAARSRGAGRAVRTGLHTFEIRGAEWTAAAPGGVLHLATGGTRVHPLATHSQMGESNHGEPCAPDQDRGPTGRAVGADVAMHVRPMVGASAGRGTMGQPDCESADCANQHGARQAREPRGSESAQGSRGDVAGVPDAGPWRFSACSAPEYAPPNRPVHVLFTPNRARAMGHGGAEAGACVGYYMARETYRALPGLALATPADFERFGPLQPAPANFLWTDSERAAEARRNSHAWPDNDTCDRPMAAPGLQSYRARGVFGWIMLGAKDDAEAMREARRSTPKPHTLQVWNGTRYVTAESFRTFATDEADERAATPVSHAEPEAKPEAAPDLAARILTTAAAHDSALTPAGLAHYGAIPAELAAIERTARELVQAGRLAMFDYSAQGQPPGFYVPTVPEYGPDSERVRAMLANVLRALAAASPGGVPTAAGLASEAARIEASAARMAAEGVPTTAGAYRHLAAALRELEETRRGDEAAERDAAAHYSDPWPVMVARAHHAAHRAPADPLLRIPAGDPRLRIPATFAPGYLLRA